MFIHIAADRKPSIMIAPESLIFVSRAKKKKNVKTRNRKKINTAEHIVRCFSILRQKLVNFIRYLFFRFVGEFTKYILDKIVYFPNNYFCHNWKDGHVLKDE